MWPFQVSAQVRESKNALKDLKVKVAQSCLTLCELLNTTNIDFISMQRPFVADPSFLVDWQIEGDGESRCITCNNCYWKKTSTCFIKPCDPAYYSSDEE